MQELARQIFWNPKKLAKKDQSGCSSGMIAEKANMLQKEKQALREKADLLQEKSHSLQKTIGVKEEAILLEEKINLQDQLIDALQSQVSPLTRRTNWMTLIATK